MKVTVFLFIYVLSLTWCYCDGYKILVVFPFPGKSHSILGDGYVRYLLEAGHEVTYITPYPKKNPHRNLHQVIVRNDTFPGIDVRLIMDNKFDLSEPVLVALLMHDVAKATLANENVKKLMNDPAQKFDVAIVEWLFSELYSGFSAVFQCPFIWSGSTEPHPYILSLIDETYNPAYVPDIVSTKLPPFSFMERLNQLYIQIMNVVARKFYMNPEEDYKQLLGPILAKKGRELPPYDEVKYNASLMLGNSHVSMGQATTLPQSFKSIGGYHIDINTPSLPKDLERLMNKSTNGVIYFSLGTNLNSKDLPDEVKTSLLNMFGRLKQTVLWKFEETMPNLPKNVHIVSWAPQLRVLTHPNCRLFITHGGLLSLIETLHVGIPVIGIPIFGDQYLNVMRAEKKGYAKKVALSYSIANDLKPAIEEMISNPRYLEKAKELSLIYHERPVPPGAELVHWVQHVARTRGAAHLRSPALSTPLYQKMFLDLAALVLVILTVTYKLLKKGLKMLCGSKKQTKTNSNKKKN